MYGCLSNFQIIRPTHECAQESLLQWTAKVHSKAESIVKNGDNSAQLDFFEKTKQKLFTLGLGKEKILNRGVQIPDCMKENFEEMKIYCFAAKEPFHGLKEKMEFYDQEVTKIFEEFYPESILPSPHLIHVTCTGYVAPSGAQKLISKRNLGNQVCTTNAYHMGCYAAIPAIRHAVGHLHSMKENSDIVHTEISSLHFNPFSHSTEQLVVQSLFADGFIKYSVKNVEHEERSLKILSMHEKIISNSTDKMRWQPHEWGFYLSLSKEVPVLIANNLDNFLELLGTKAKKKKEQLLQSYFAIHPGGPKIIDQIAARLNLDETQIYHSQQILKNCGNMSSATLPHVWEKMLKDSNIQSGSLIVSMAFGPGLSISGTLFEKLC